MVVAPETIPVDTSMVAALLVTSLMRRGVDVTADPQKLARAYYEIARALDHLGVDHDGDEPGAGELLACVAATERIRRRHPGQRRAQAMADQDAAWVREAVQSC